MLNSIIAAVSIFIAVVIGILALVLPQENLNFVIVISRFFEVMLPFLAAGALIKYLLRREI